MALIHTAVLVSFIGAVAFVASYFTQRMVFTSVTSVVISALWPHVPLLRASSALEYLLHYSNTRSIEIATTTQSVGKTCSISVPGTTNSESKENDADALRPATVISKKNANGSSSEIEAGTFKTINFNNLQSMAFTKPTLLSYFGNEKQEVSWKSLYVDTCSLLIEDYPMQDADT